MASRKKTSAAAPKFSKAELIAAASSFETQPEIMAGALYRVEEATREETEKRLKAFLNKGVK
jgi:hypothetical protein